MAIFSFSISAMERITCTVSGPETCGVTWAKIKADARGIDGIRIRARRSFTPALNVVFREALDCLVPAVCGEHSPGTGS